MCDRSAIQYIQWSSTVPVVFLNLQSREVSRGTLSLQDCFFERVDKGFAINYSHDLIIIRDLVIAESHSICGLTRFKHQYSLEFF